MGIKIAKPLLDINFRVELYRSRNNGLLLCLVSTKHYHFVHFVLYMCLYGKRTIRLTQSWKYE